MSLVHCLVTTPLHIFPGYYLLILSIDLRRLLDIFSYYSSLKLSFGHSHYFIPYNITVPLKLYKMLCLMSGYVNLRVMYLTGVDWPQSVMSGGRVGGQDKTCFQLFRTKIFLFLAMLRQNSIINISLTYNISILFFTCQFIL